LCHRLLASVAKQFVRNWSVRTTATGILPGSEIRNITSNDRAVVTERIEVTEMGGRPLTLHINGVFEVENGKIVAWRDYYDTADVASQLGIDVHDIARWMEPATPTGDPEA
jgi:limonene-1,2-epoxide hydrolase